MSKPIENLVFDFLDQSMKAAANDSLLKTAELHDTIYQEVKKDLGVRIGDAESDLLPSPDGNLKEFDGFLQLVCYARVLKSDKTERLLARNRVFDLSAAVVALFIGDPSLGNRVCDAQILSIVRGYDSINGQPYAVTNLPLVVNPTGAINFSRRHTNF